MPQKILLHNQEISYDLRKSERARCLRIAIYANLNIVVTLPAGKSEREAATYLQKKAKWVINTLDKFRKIKISNPFAGKSALPRRSIRDFRQNKEKALVLIKNLIEKINKTYQFEYRRISIRNQKTRWGSCSKKGNLNFNYRIIFLPPKLAEYIVVHELCHLKELNHSRRFWNLVGKVLPDYKKLIKELKGNF